MDLTSYNVFAIVYWVILSIVLIRTLQGSIALLSVISWLKRKNLASPPSYPSAKHTIYVVIPVLREQKIIESTVNYFLNLDYPADLLKLILVSTEKEIAEQKNPEEETTMNLIKRICQERSDSRIVHLHYQDPKGKMVDQLNFAFGYLTRKSGAKMEKTFAAVYNADSRPHRKTFSLISDLAEAKGGRVYQQSSVYFNNFSEVEDKNGFFAAKYIKTNALLQTRWTIVHEIPRLLRQSYFLSKKHLRLFLAHCVGHGLFLRGDLLKELKEMPTGTVTEDLFFGYVLSLLGEPIFPVPLLEGAEVPVIFRNTLQQKYVWFFGPLDHLKYSSYFKFKFPQKTSIYLRSWFTFQGLIPAVAWFCSGWFFILIVTFPLLAGNWLLFWLGLALFIINAPLSYLFILVNHKFISRISSGSENICALDFLWIVLLSPIAVFLHSLPPWLTLYRSVVSVFTNKYPQKPKTERS